MTTETTTKDAALLDTAAAAAEAAAAAIVARDAAIRAAVGAGFSVREVAARIPKEGGGTMSASRVHQIASAA